MKKSKLIDELRSLGTGPTDTDLLRWSESVESLAGLEIAASRGLVVVLQLDDRGGCAEYNVTVSDGPGPPAFNQRSVNLPETLRAAVNSCDESRKSLERWTKVVELLAALDSISREGYSVLLKIDGERENGDIYTVVISGEEVESSFHQDSANLPSILADAIAFYVNQRKLSS